MDGTVDVSIPVDPQAAEALSSRRAREAVGRIVSRILKPQNSSDPLLASMARLGAEAERRGLTEVILDEELAAHKAERRQLAGPTGCPTD